MTTELRKDSSILVIGGGGTVGSSTALHLARRGYTNVHTIDVYPIPSAQSAGNDMNKIFGTLGKPFEANLSREAHAAWSTDEIFKPYFHETGRFNSSLSETGIAHLREEYDALKSAGLADGVEWLGTREDIVKRVPQLKDSEIDGWQGMYIQKGGWVAARQAIDSAGRELEKLGVKRTFGPAGTFKELILSEDGSRCLGVVAADGTRHLADRIVLAAGAWSPVLVDLKGQCVSKAWVYAHFKLTPEEAAFYKDMPVAYNGDLGFFFEPNADGIIKICDEFPGFTHLVKRQPFGAPEPLLISEPRSHAAHPTDTIPDASLASIRKALAAFIPDKKDIEFFDIAMCWCTDTGDADWLVCEHPDWKGFFLATGDSGHTFKHFPTVGKYVADLLEGKLAQEYLDTWRWRPGEGPDPLQSCRAAPAKDLADMPGWKHDDEPDV